MSVMVREGVSASVGDQVTDGAEGERLSDGAVSEWEALGVRVGEPECDPQSEKLRLGLPDGDRLADRVPGGLREGLGEWDVERLAVGLVLTDGSVWEKLREP